MHILLRFDTDQNSNLPYLARQGIKAGCFGGKVDQEENSGIVAKPEVVIRSSMSWDPNIPLPNSNSIFLLQSCNGSNGQVEPQLSTATDEGKLCFDNSSAQHCSAFTPVEPRRPTATSEENLRFGSSPAFTPIVLQPPTTSAEENLHLGNSSPHHCSAFTPVEPRRPTATSEENLRFASSPAFRPTPSSLIRLLYVTSNRSQELLPLESSAVNSSSEEIQNPKSQQRTGNETSSNSPQSNMSSEDTNNLSEPRVDRRNEYECSECSKVFVTRSRLKEHMGSHTRPFECPQCHKKFGKNAHLKSHIRIHTGEKPYACPECKRKFAQNVILNHMRIHTGEKPFLCDKCPRTFAQSSALRRHKLTHTGEKPHKCDKCGKAFAAAWNCRAHRKRQHPGE